MNRTDQNCGDQNRTELMIKTEQNSKNRIDDQKFKTEQNSKNRT
jgi:hypothetical protein